jgi:hypothetical protein
MPLPLFSGLIAQFTPPKRSSFSPVCHIGGGLFFCNIRLVALSQRRAFAPAGLP